MIDRAPMTLTAALVLTACGGGPSPSTAGTSPAVHQTPEGYVLGNLGDGELEGHTPRGFEGQGSGPFVGDNINPKFPDGDGVQLFLSFDLKPLPRGMIASAKLRAKETRVAGEPFASLGKLMLEEVRFDQFSKALWNSEGSGERVFASSKEGPFECDVTDIVDRRRSTQMAQVRLRFEKAGDGDGVKDVVYFNPKAGSADHNEPGLLELVVQVDDVLEK